MPVCSVFSRMSDSPISTLLARFNPSLASAILAADRRVVKRDGSLVPWDPARIVRAVARAFYDVQHAGAENPLRDDPAARFGLDQATFDKVQQIATRAARMLELFYRTGRHPTIEQIQDTVEKSIAAEGEWDVARSYIIYRERHAAHRLNHYTENGLSDYIAISKYARYRRELGRRESFAEASRRVLAMHLEHFKERLALRLPPPDETTSPALPADRRLLTEWLAGGTLSDALHRAFGAVARKRVLPSMRSLQFGGEAILKNHARLFNCSFSPVDRVEFFREYFFLLLAGTGCGFSVQRHHVDRLPALPMRGEEMELTVIHHAIEDTIEGWADALHFLMRSHIERFKVEFNYSAIRPRGSALRTAGGKAPGHLPLKQALLDADAILTGAAGRKLRPIEVYDICMFTARAVLSGGIRRSATICLFSPDDQEMMDAKTGNWFEKHPQRSASNNSAVLSRAGTDVAQFRRLFSAQKEFGEPGFYFADQPDYGCNPCVPAETWVMTAAGPRQVSELIGQPFSALVHGEAHNSTGHGFFRTGTKTVFSVRTEQGHSFKATGNHLVQVLRGVMRPRNPENPLGSRLRKPQTEWVPVSGLRTGDSLVLHRHAGVTWAGFGDKEQGWLIGSLLGDGNVSDNTAYLDYWGADKNQQLTRAVRALHATVGGRSDMQGGEQPKYDRVRVGSARLAQLARQFGLRQGSKRLEDSVERTSSDFYIGFLQGWLDADGSVQGSQKKGVSVRLTSVELGNLRIAQRMLLRLGINSTLYSNRSSEGNRMLPDGRGGLRPYYCQSVHELIVASENIGEFERRIGFSEPSKAARLAENLAGYKRQSNHDDFTAALEEIENLGEQPVYDCTVPGPDAFDGNGFMLHNCCEIGLHPVIEGPLSDTETAKLRALGYTGPLDAGTRLSGWQMCNLSTINGAALQTVDDFLVACIQAAVIGTVQASYTVIPYLGPVTRYLNERDSLLGVSVCGFMDNPEILFNPEVLERGARLCRAANEIVAQAIGIRPAARVTCVKPEGTASLLLGAASGIHPHHARHYFRRVQANRRDAVYRHFRATNPHMTEASVYRPETDDVITFAVEAPAHAILRDEVGAVDFLRFVQLVQRHWVLCGEAVGSRSPGLHHNVSNTCSVKPGEWDAVSDFIWLHREDFTGVALLGYEGDKRYPQAPREEVIGEDDLAKWNRLRYETVNYTRLEESTDETKLKEVAACAGGACELT